MDVISDLIIEGKEISEKTCAEGMEKIQEKKGFVVVEKETEQGTMYYIEKDRYLFAIEKVAENKYEVTYKGTGEIEQTHTHQYGEFTIDKEATCGEEGSRSQHCTIEGCTEINVEVIPKTDNHNYGEYIIEEKATCVKSGTKSRICSVCNKQETVAIEALGHSYNTQYKTDIEATCTEKGTKSRTCSVCNKQETAAIEALGHNYDTEYTIDKNATCTEAGTQSRTCLVCGNVETITIGELGHQWNTEYTTDIVATCYSVGTKSIHCLRCEEKKDETEIPLTDHNYGSTKEKIDSKYHGYKCSEYEQCKASKDAEEHTYGSKAIAYESNLQQYKEYHHVDCTICGAYKNVAHSESSKSIQYTGSSSKHNVSYKCACGVVYASEELSHTYSNTYSKNSSTTCKKVSKCSGCGYSTTTYPSHSYTNVYCPIKQVSGNYKCKNCYYCSKCGNKH